MKTNFTERQLRYIEARAQGLKGREAVIHAGFSPAGADVTASRLNQRADITAAIKAKKKSLPGGGKSDDGEAPMMKPKYMSSLELMRDCYNNPRMPASIRFEAAKQALPYEHARVGEKGKKDQAKDEAAKVSKSAGRRFKTKQPPQLRVVK